MAKILWSGFQWCEQLAQRQLWHMLFGVKRPFVFRLKENHKVKPSVELAGSWLIMSILRVTMATRACKEEN